MSPAGWSAHAKLTTDEIPLLLSNIMLHPHWVGCARRWKVRFKSCYSTCQLWVWQKTWYWNIGNECKPFFEEAVFFLVVCFRKLVFHLILVAELLSMRDSKPASPGMTLSLSDAYFKHAASHTAPKKFENTALFLRVGLPSTLMRHENGAFRKHFSNRRNLKTPALRFRVDGKHLMRSQLETSV